MRDAAVEAMNTAIADAAGNALAMELKRRAEAALASCEARFCDEHRGIYKTSGCVVCGIMRLAQERERLKAQLAAAIAEARRSEPGPVSRAVAPQGQSDRVGDV